MPLRCTKAASVTCLHQLGIEVVTGGAERVDSVGNALLRVRAEAERQRLEKVRKRGESIMSRGLRDHSPSAAATSTEAAH